MSMICFKRLNSWSNLYGDLREKLLVNGTHETLVTVADDVVNGCWSPNEMSASSRQIFLMFRCSLPCIRLDQSVVSCRLHRILDVCDNLLEHTWCGSGSSVCRAIFLGLSSSVDLGELLLVLLKLLCVDLLLEGLGLFLLHNSTVLSNLLNIELMLSLELVRLASSTEETTEEEDGEEPASNGVPGECVCIHDAEGEDAPPVESVHDPEKDEAANDLHVVEARVLVYALVVRWVDWVVAGAVAGEFGILAFLGVCVDGSQHIL